MASSSVTRMTGGACSTRVAPGRLRVARPQRGSLLVSNATSDYSIHVNGDIRKVFKYITDVTNRPTWDSATVRVTPASSSAPATGAGAKYDCIQMPLPAVKIPVRYAVSEYEFPKKMVIWGKADDFMTTTTYIFMEHPVRPNHTIVRQIYDVKMQDWKAMIPMLEQQLAKKEAAAVQTLERLLNSNVSPLVSVELDEHDLRHNYRPKHPKREQAAPAWGVPNNLGSMFSGMFTPRSNGNGNGSASASASGTQQQQQQAVPQAAVTTSDVLGYYRVLGLEASAQVTADDIKSAFRRAALQVHPDRMVGADDKTKQAAQIQFQILQAAYETLKDPEKRVMYDRGQLVASSVE